MGLILVPLYSPYKLKDIDIDQDNRNLMYSIVDGDDIPASFKLNATSGELTQLRDLDRETTGYYNLTIQVIDSTSPPVFTATLFVNITVDDLNDEIPVLVVEDVEIRGK